MYTKAEDKRERLDGGVNQNFRSVFYLLCSILFFAGCADKHAKPDRLTAEQRQQQLLNDPFGYKGETTKADITGGGIGHFDKDAFKKDVDHVLSP